MMDDDDIECNVVEHEEAMDQEDNDVEVAKNQTPKTFIPGVHDLDDNEELVMDESAYKVYYQLNVESSSLSFDILRDNLGDNRAEAYPLTAYMIAGTQAVKSHSNKLILMKLSNLHAIKHEEKNKDDDNSDEEDEDLDTEPVVESALIQHNGTVNRTRAQQFGGRYLAATWSEMGQVYIWDLSRPLMAVNDSAIMAEYTRSEESPSPIFTFRGHNMEGFALDWSPVVSGRLATGDCMKNIHIWNPASNGAWNVDPNPLIGHKASVEDIQWSPSEASVMISSSVDHSIRIWDVRDKPTSACKINLPEAHSADVNVISWNKLDATALVSGGDDGTLRVWDLRHIKRSPTDGSAQYIHSYSHHKSAITSVQWHPQDRSVFAASGEDDQLTLWDVSIEQEEHVSAEDQLDVLHNLLFIHMGQKEIKELHWHPQIPGLILSTALDGYNVFRTINV